MRALLTLAVFAVLLVPAHADDHIRVRPFTEPDGNVYQGQLTCLLVEVETDTWFTTAPRYPEIRVDGAVVLQPDAFGVNFTRREGGKTWAGQRQRNVVFPQRPGTLELPGFTVTAGDPGRVVAGFWRWSDRLPGRGTPLSLTELAAVADDPFDERRRRFAQARYGKPGKPGGAATVPVDAGLLRRLRESWHDGRSPARISTRQAASGDRPNP